MRALQPLLAEEADDLLGQRLDRGTPGQLERRRLAVTRQIDQDQLTAGRQQRGDGLPRLPVVPDAVQKHEWRPRSHPFVRQPHDATSVTGE